MNEFVDWYCSEPRLSFSRTVVLRYHGAVQAKFLDAPRQLLRRTFRGRSWQGRKPLEPLRHSLNCRRKLIVGG